LGKAGKSPKPNRKKAVQAKRGGGKGKTFFRPNPVSGQETDAFSASNSAKNG